VTLETLDVALLAGALVLLVAVVAVRLSVRVGLPSLLLYLGIGMAVGESGVGVRFEDAGLTLVLGFAALVVILAEGGLTTRWDTIRPVFGVGIALATVGVVVSVAVTAVVAHLALGVEWRIALLLGAVVSSTDAAAVFSTLRRLPLPPRLVAALEVESGLNDAPAVLLVSLLASQAWSTTHPAQAAAFVVYELLAGAVIGLAIGRIGQEVVARSALPSAGLYPLAVFALTVLAYAAAGLAHASGFLAVYLAALWLGNARLPHRRATLGFAEGLAWVAQIGLFVMLGLLVSPSRLGAAVLPAVVVGLGLLLLARPLSVIASTVAFRTPLRQQVFLSWAGLRGAVPIVLATIPLTSGLPEGQRIFDTVFVLVVLFTLVQGPTLPAAARMLRLTDPTQPRELTVESAPLEELRADLLQVSVPPESKLRGVYLPELRLPAGAAVTLVVRDNRSFVPDDGTRINAGDQLLVVATAQSRAAAERRLHAVSRSGRLARWFGETGEESRTAVAVGRSSPAAPFPLLRRFQEAGRRAVQRSSLPRRHR
jgi:cell volume regulation protein A